MAVVFISPKKRQRTFFAIITLIFLLFLIIISIGVFLSKPKEVLPTVIFNKSKINIDMSIFDSEKFKSLQLFTDMNFQYKYKVITASKKTEEGFVSAGSITEARAILERMGLTVVSIDEVITGRDNPFVPYYNVVRATTVTP